MATPNTVDNKVIQLPAWIVTALVSVAILISAYFFNRIQSSIDGIAKDMGALTSNVLVVQNRTTTLEERMTRLEALYQSTDRISRSEFEKMRDAIDRELERIRDKLDDVSAKPLPRR